MAVLQKIRNKGVLLVSSIAVALFLFVIGDLLRGGEGLINQSRQIVGKIDGNSVSIPEYQNLFEEFQVYREFSQRTTSSSEDENNQTKDMAWQTYLRNKLVEKECEALGLTVTTSEIEEILRTGSHQLLMVPAFANQETGRYDYSYVTQVMHEYDNLKNSGQQVSETHEKFHKYYLFAQKQIRSELLYAKYQTLLSRCFLSNPVEAKRSYEARTNESNILLVSVPFTSVADDKVEVSDKDIQAKYNADKAQYQQYVETRDIKIIDVPVAASEADKKALESDMQVCYEKLQAVTSGAEAESAVRQSVSVFPYTNILKGRNAFPDMIASRLDNDTAAVAVGQTLAPVYDAMTNTYYTFKLIAKASEADSVLFRQIGVIGKDEKDIAGKADSIVNALSAGANFKEIAKKYNQTGDSVWVATAQYQQGQLDADNTLFITTLYGMSAGQTKKLTLSNGNTVILQVLATRNPITKYNVAAIIKELKFSDETYNTEYNKFSSFIAANPTLEKIEANAEKSGYTVRPLSNISTSNHNIAGIHNTRDAVKWIFDEADKGEVSQLYQCGDNDHLMIVALDAINKEGYVALDKVKEDIKSQLLNDKKAETILALASGAKSVADAKKVAGAVADTINHVSFAAPAFISSTMASEPVVSALAAKTAKGAFAGPVKGNRGVYMLQVLDKSKTAEKKYDEKAEQTQQAQTNSRYAVQSCLNSLYLNANVKDLRYKFF